MNTAELARKIEQSIILMLVAARFRNPNDHPVPRLFVYDQIMNMHRREGVITTGFFSRIVGDMKRTGIIGTAKGGDVLFMTDAYWKISGGEKQKRDSDEQQERVAIDILDHLVGGPRSREYFRNVLPAEAQASVNNVLKVSVGEGLLEIHDEQYQPTEKLRAHFTEHVVEGSVAPKVVS